MEAETEPWPILEKKGLQLSQLILTLELKVIAKSNKGVNSNLHILKLNSVDARIYKMGFMQAP